MSKWIAFILLCTSFFFRETFAQVNLVPNPSFENLVQCPSGAGAIADAIGWSILKNGGGGNPELYNVCCTQPYACGVPSHPGNWGFQFPHSGNSYAGIDVVYSVYPNNFREYIQSKLIQKLKAGNSYCINFYVNLSDLQGAYIKKLGAYLDSGNVSAPIPHGLALVTPQVYSNQPLTDTLNWIKIEGYFVATGIEDYITLGNFFPDSTSGIGFFGTTPPTWASYYDIDDVSVIDISTPPYAGRDTSIIQGDSVFIGKPSEIGLNEDCIWFVNGNPIDTIAGMWVKPASTTTFVLQQTICGTVTYDTVVVTVNPNGVEQINLQSLINIFPNPTTGDIWIKIDNNISNNCTVIIYDIVGEKVFEQNMTIKNPVKITPELNSGTYFVTIKSKNTAMSMYNGKITVIK